MRHCLGDAFSLPGLASNLQNQGTSVKTLLTAVFAFLSAGVDAAVLYDSGAPTLTTFACDSGPNACQLGFDDYWTVFDDFQINEASEISGFSFVDEVYRGNPAENYRNTRWSLYAVNPASGGAPFAIGTSVATVTPLSGAGVFDFSVDVSPVWVQPGVYWLGISNEFSGGAESTPLGVVAKNPALMAGFYQYTPVLGAYWQQQVGDRAMKIHGSVVPEPSAVALFGIGLCGLALATRRHRATEAIRKPAARPTLSCT